MIQFALYPKILKDQDQECWAEAELNFFHNDPEYFYCKITFCRQKDKTLKNDTYVKGTKEKSASLANHAHL